MILNLVVVLIVFGVLFSFLIERKCILAVSDYIAPVWPTSLLAIIWTMELGIVIKRFLYGITDNTLMFLVICGLALIFRIPITIGNITMLKNSKEKEDDSL